MRRFVVRCVMLGMALLPASAATARGATQQPADVAANTEVKRLRAELEALRRDYAERLAALEARLAALEAPAAAAAQTPAPTPVEPPTPPPETATQAEVPAGAAGAGGPSGPLPVYGAASTSALSKVFNPDVAVIGNFLGAMGENPFSEQPALEMSEAELSLQAVVDPYARADFFLTFGPEEVGIEEGYLTFQSLPGGLLMKVGKMKAAFGKVNTYHPHNLPYADRPLVSQNLVGGDEGINEAGLSISRLLPNDFVFLEATGEVFSGASELFQAPRRRDLTYVGRLRAYRDLSDSANLDLGGSIAYGTNDVGQGFHTRLIGADVSFRYRPLRRAIYRRFLARSELVWSRREELEGRRDAFGAYLSGEYQFARRWFAGARFDYSERAEDPALIDKGYSLLLTFWPSEFSQVRGQYRRTRYAEGETANEFLFQFLFSIGAHGAHPF